MPTSPGSASTATTSNATTPSTTHSCRPSPGYGPTTCSASSGSTGHRPTASTTRTGGSRVTRPGWPHSAAHCGPTRTRRRPAWKPPTCRTPLRSGRPKTRTTLREASGGPAVAPGAFAEGRERLRAAQPPVLGVSDVEPDEPEQPVQADSGEQVGDLRRLARGGYGSGLRDEDGSTRYLAYGRYGRPEQRTERRRRVVVVAVDADPGHVLPARPPPGRARDLAVVR